MTRAPKPDCIFCRIASHALKANVVAETDTLIAFHDINPQAPRHILIVPKVHISTINDLAPEECGLIGDMVRLARDLAEDHEFAEPGYRLIMNCNQQGGQSVYHIHLHVLAGRYLTWPPG